MKTFADDLASLINKHGIDTECDARDFIVAEFLAKVLRSLTEMKADLHSRQIERMTQIGKIYLTNTMSSGEFAARIMVALGLVDAKDTFDSAGQLGEYAPSKLIDPRGRPLPPVASGPLHYDTAQISQEIIMNVLNHGDPRPIWDKIVDAIIADMSDRRGLKHEWDAIDEDVKREIRVSWASIIREQFAKWSEESTR